jgi:hypothetical protein
MPEFSNTDQRSVDLVSQALPGTGPKSPNAPENKAAREAESRADIAAIQSDRRVREDVVRKSR